MSNKLIKIAKKKNVSHQIFLICMIVTLILGYKPQKNCLTVLLKFIGRSTLAQCIFILNLTSVISWLIPSTMPPAAVYWPAIRTHIVYYVASVC